MNEHTFEGYPLEGDKMPESRIFCYSISAMAVLMGIGFIITPLQLRGQLGADVDKIRNMAEYQDNVNNKNRQDILKLKEDIEYLNAHTDRFEYKIELMDAMVYSLPGVINDRK